MTIEFTPVLVLSLVSVLLLGLSAGLFFAFSAAVMPGLRRIDDRSYVTAFNGINVAILNPLFFVVFVGALLVPAATAIVAFATGQTALAWWQLAATAVYLLGVIIVTGAVNVPLNNALARDGDRAAFETRWVRFNHLRSVASTLAFALALVATLQG
jgi:uncharacterized membrane protein